MKRGWLCLGLAVCLSPPDVSYGRPAGTQMPFRRVADAPDQRPELSLDEAVRRVQRDTGGRVLAAETLPGAGGAMYRIKVLLPSGRVKVILVDPRR